MYFYPTHQIIRSDNVLSSNKNRLFRMIFFYVHKADVKREGGWANADIADTGGRGGCENTENG